MTNFCKNAEINNTNYITFILSEQVSAEATTKNIFGIDWSRLFHQETGSIKKSSALTINFASMPVVGNVVKDQTSNYALYELMNNNPGYDVIYYPQYVKVTARLGKLENKRK